MAIKIGLKALSQLDRAGGVLLAGTLRRRVIIQMKNEMNAHVSLSKGSITYQSACTIEND